MPIPGEAEQSIAFRQLRFDLLQPATVRTIREFNAQKFERIIEVRNPGNLESALSNVFKPKLMIEEVKDSHVDLALGCRSKSSISPLCSPCAFPAETNYYS